MWDEVYDNMNFRILMTSLLAFFSASAFAISPGSLSQVAEGVECEGQKLRADNFKDLRVLASAPSDAAPRRPIEKEAPKYGHTPEQIAHIRSATGYIQCDETLADGTKIKSSASASMIGAAGQVTTAAHLFATDGRRRNLKNCEFWNQAKDQQHVAIDLDDMAIGSLNPEKDVLEDFAHVRLKGNLRGVKPIPVDISGQDVTENDEYFAVSAYEEDLKSDRKQPLFRPLIVTQVVRSGENVAAKVKAAVNGGGSGGLNYYINSKGEVVAKMIFIRGADKSLNGKPYNDGTVDRAGMNFNGSLALSGDVLKSLVAFSEGRTIYTASAAGGSNEI